MSSSKQYLSIRAAIMNCIGRCSESDMPLVALADFLEKLAALGWSPEDVQKVGDAVLPLLGQLKDSDTVRIGPVNLVANQPPSGGTVNSTSS